MKKVRQAVMITVRLTKIQRINRAGVEMLFELMQLQLNGIIVEYLSAQGQIQTELLLKLGFSLTALSR